MNLATIFTAAVLVFVGVRCLNDVQSSNDVAPLVEMNDGRKIPSFGLGTWLGTSQQGERIVPAGNEVEHAVDWAIEAGYRHIDTAFIYNTEEQVGRAVNKKVADGVVKREDLFITSKLWCDKHKKEDVIPALRESLKRLNLTYVDLYLIHWPIAIHANGSISDVDYVETWSGMMDAKHMGLAKSIGVSNFNQQFLERLIGTTQVKPAVLQVEINLNLQQPALLEYCHSQNIVVTGYTPFGSLFGSKGGPNAPPPRVNDQALVEIANKYNKSVPQIALRYLVELGVIPIPKSVKKERIEENLNIFDFHLSPEDRIVLRSYDKNYRTVTVERWIASPYYPFEKRN